MQILQTVLSLLSRKRFVKDVKDDDYFYVSRNKSANEIPNYESRAISGKELLSQVTGAQGPDGAQGPAGPKGDEGPAGPVGAAGLVFRSTWNPATSYVVGDVVFYDGSSYVCSNNVTSTTPPNADTTNWDFLALQGLQGPAGGGFAASVVNKAGTGSSTAQVRLNSILIPANSFTAGDVFSYKAMFAKIVSGAGAQCLAKMYIGDAPNLSGTNYLLQVHRMAPSARAMTVGRDFYVDSLGTYAQDSGTQDDNSPYLQTGSTFDTYTIDWTIDQYFVVTANNAGGGSQEAFNIGAKIY